MNDNYQITRLRTQSILLEERRQDEKLCVKKLLNKLLWRPRRLDNTRSRTRNDKRVAVLSPWPRGQFCRINLIEHHSKICW